MMFDDAIRLTEILLGAAFIQQGAEHMTGPRSERILFGARIVLSLLLIVGIETEIACAALVVTSLFMLKLFQGPYNGGSDRMGLLILCALTLTKFLPDPHWQEYALGYLALQVMLSYFIAGFVKIVNADWRTGLALHDVFLFSAYPAAQSFRNLANHPRLLLVASWAVMGFEILFPLTLTSHTALMAGLTIAAFFHLANACLFGLNRFFWIWLAAYPSLFWLQDRIFS